VGSNIVLQVALISRKFSASRHSNNRVNPFIQAGKCQCEAFQLSSYAHVADIRVRRYGYELENTAIWSVSI
jgi:hypothetical protein